MNEDYQYWSRALRQNLSEDHSSVMVVAGQTVSVKLNLGDSPAPTFDEGSVFHLDPAGLTVNGLRGGHRAHIASIPWDRISSITFSYHGLPRDS